MLMQGIDFPSFSGLRPRSGRSGSHVGRVNTSECRSRRDYAYLCLRHCCCDRLSRPSGIRAGQPRRHEVLNGEQATCNLTAAKAPTKLGQRIAQTAIDEFTRFGGHQIDSDGRLFHFGLTEAEHEEDDGGNPLAPLGHFGWWQVIKYWRGLFGDDPTSKLEVRGYRDASASTQDTQEAALLRTSAAQLLRLAEGVSDPDMREILRETALRAAIIDTSWSAAFISYVIRQSGVAPNAFQFANAHRVYIYDAFAVSAAEQKNDASDAIYRACPLTTRPRAGDLICQQR